MNSPMSHKISCSLIFVLSLFVCTASNAWHGGGGGYRGGYHGGAYHDRGYGGGYHGGYYRGGGYGGGYYRGGGWGWGRAGVVGVPLGGYYAPRCTIVKRCYANGNCVRNRVCN